jgi:hypothetical protein
MRKLRGDSSSRILLIAPPCTEPEYRNGIPFCDEAAEVFHNILLSEVNLDTERDFCIVSASRYGLKPCKHSTDLIKGFIESCARRAYFQYYVCVGDDAFKYIFGQGKKPSSNTLMGSTVFRPEIGFKPLFVFPSTSVLAPTMGESEWENRKATRIADEFNVKFSKFAVKLGESINQYKNK